MPRMDLADRLLLGFAGCSQILVCRRRLRCLILRRQHWRRPEVAV